MSFRITKLYNLLQFYTQIHTPGARMQGHHLVVIIWHSVGTAAVSSDAMRPDDSHQYFLPLLWKLHRHIM